MTPHIDWSEGIRGLLLGPESLWNIRCYKSPLWGGLHKITISCRRRSLSIVAGRMELQGSPKQGRGLQSAACWGSVILLGMVALLAVRWRPGGILDDALGRVSLLSLTLKRTERRCCFRGGMYDGMCVVAEGRLMRCGAVRYH